MAIRYVRMIKEIIEVPLPRAASRRLISFFTFHISICRHELDRSSYVVVKARKLRVAMKQKGEATNILLRFVSLRVRHLV